jgi:hypothetical protein
LRQLATDRRWTVRQRVAEHPQCPPALLSKLATDQHWIIRRAVAEHPKCTGRVLRHLLADHNEEVQNGAKNNSNLPDEYRQLLRLVR